MTVGLRFSTEIFHYLCGELVDARGSDRGLAGCSQRHHFENKLFVAHSPKGWLPSIKEPHDLM